MRKKFLAVVLSVVMLLGSGICSLTSQAADKVVNRDDGIWLFPLDKSYYNKFSDWAACPGWDSCDFCGCVHSDLGDGSHNNTNGGHNGVDIAAPVGTPVYAAASGKVAYIGGSDSNARGLYLLIEHPIDGTYSYYSCYQHLNKNDLLSVGSNVLAGDKIAISGNTGYGSGAHLHFGIVRGNAGFSGDPYSIECNGWLKDNNGQIGKILNNPDISGPSGRPGGNGSAGAISHQGSVKYTFNKSEVSIGTMVSPELTFYESYAGNYKVTNTDSDGLYVRSGPGVSYSKIGELYYGTYVQVYSATGEGQGNWAKINYNGNVAYAAMAFLEKESDIDANIDTGYAGDYVSINTDSDGLYIRSGPGTGYTKLGEMLFGSTLYVYGATGEGSGNWAKISYAGIEGYAAMAYLQRIPTNPWISTNHSSITVGDNVTFSFGAEYATKCHLGIDKSGVGRIKDFYTSDGSYTHTFDSVGTYTAYITSYNDNAAGVGRNSNIVTITVNEKTYAVRYNANGGSGAPGTQTKIYGTNLILSSTIPTREGYTFKSWNTNADGSGTAYSAGGTYSANTGVTLYAQWTLNKPTNVTIKADKTSFVLGESITFTLGQSGGTGAVIGIDKDGTRVDSPDVYGKSTYTYTPKSAGTYTAYHSAWNSSGYTDSAKVIFTVAAPKPGTPVVQVSNTQYKVTDDITISWTPVADAAAYWVYIRDKNGEDYINQSVGTNTSFTTKYDAGNYTVFVSAYNSTGETVGNPVTFYVYDSLPTKPVISGYKLEYSFGEEVSINWVNDGTAHSYWLYIYDRTNNTDYADYKIGSETSYSHTFPAGEYTVYIEGVNCYGTAKSDGINISVGAYDIFYDANGGFSAPDIDYKIHNKDLKITDDIPTKEGYTFLGWATSSDAASAEYQPGGIYSENSSVTLYAVWAKEIVPTKSADVTVGTVVGRSGEEVTVPVCIENNPGIAGFSFTIEFDKTKLVPVSVEKGDALTAGTLTSNLHQGGDMGSYDVVTAYWVNPSNVAANGDILNVKFKIKDDVSDCEIPVNVSCEEGDISDQNYNDVALRIINGKIVVENIVPGDVKSDGAVNTKDGVRLSQYLAKWDMTLTSYELKAADVFKDGAINTKDGVKLSQHLAKWDIELSEVNLMSIGKIKFKIGNVSTKAGDIIDVPVYITETSGVAGFNVSVEFDKNLLEPISITQGEALNAGTLTSNLHQGGDMSRFDNVSAYWVNPYNLKGTGVAFTVSFKVKDETVGEIPIVLTYDELDKPCDQSYNELDVSVVNGSVFVEAEVVYDYVINSIVGEAPESGSFYSEVSVTKLTERDSKDIIVIAVYKDGVMIDKICMKAKFNKGESVEFGGWVTAAEGCELKAFVWDSLSSMKALAESK